MSFGWYIRGLRRRAGPTERPKRVEYGIETNFHFFGSVFGTEEPGLLAPKARLIRKQLKVTNKTAESLVSLFIRALHNYVVEEFAAKDAHHSLDELQTEVIVTVPTTWSDKVRIDITQVSLSRVPKWRLPYKNIH